MALIVDRSQGSILGGGGISCVLVLYLFFFPFFFYRWTLCRILKAYGPIHSIYIYSNE